MRTPRPAPLTIGLAVAFALPVLAFGHGGVPVGLVLAWGATGWDAMDWGWTAPVYLGWSAIVLLVAGLLAPRRVGATLMWLGAAASLASWSLFAARTESLSLTLITSLPYLGCLAVWARRAERPWRLE